MTRKEQQTPAMTEAEARQALADVRSPKLEALRADIPKMVTSKLLGLIVHSEALAEMLEDGPYDPKTGPPTYKYTVDEETVIVGAALQAIGDEIDRRIPVPTEKQ